MRRTPRAPGAFPLRKDVVAWAEKLVGKGAFQWDEDAVWDGLIRPLDGYARRADAGLPATLASLLLETAGQNPRAHAALLASLRFWTAGGVLAEETLGGEPASSHRRPFYLAADVGSALTLSMTAQNMSRFFIFNRLEKTDTKTRISLHREASREMTAWSVGLGCRFASRGEGSPPSRAAFLSMARCSTVACGLRLAVSWTSELFPKLSCAVPALHEFCGAISVSLALARERRRREGGQARGWKEFIEAESSHWRGEALRLAAVSGLGDGFALKLTRIAKQSCR